MPAEVKLNISTHKPDIKYRYVDIETHFTHFTGCFKCANLTVYCTNHLDDATHSGYEYCPPRQNISADVFLGYFTTLEPRFLAGGLQ